MPKITIKEAAELTGKAKRTIQRYISAGKLSYTDRPDNTRMLDKDEIIATFGRPATTVTHDASHDVTKPDPQQMAALMQGLQQAIIESQAPLLAQIAELTDKVDKLTNQLEHKPEPVVQEVENGGSVLAAKAVEAAITGELPTETEKDGTRDAPLAVDIDGYLKIPVFGRG